MQSVANALTPERLGSIIAGVDANDNIDYLTLAEEMEERDLHYRNVISIRKLAVSSLERVVEAATDDAKDVEIADFVREIVMKDQFQMLLTSLLDANAKGYSVAEIMWDRGDKWVPREYRWRDQRFFQFDRDTGLELRLRDEVNHADGVALEPYKFVVYRPELKTGLTLRAGLARVAAVAYMCKSYSLKDWLAFIEVYGMPLRVGRYGPNADEDAKSKLLAAVARIGIDAAAIIPQGMDIEFIETGMGKAQSNDKIFSGMAEYQDSQVSKGVLGQTMTTDDGSSLSQATVHNEVRTDIRNSDAMQLSATIRRDIVKAVVDLNFPGPHENYPVFRFAIEEPEDLVALSTALPPFIKLGLRVEQSVILDKFGLPEPEEGAEILSVPKPQPIDSSDDEKDEPGEKDDTKEPVDDDDDDDKDTARALASDMYVQVLLFSRTVYTREQAVEWASNYGYKTTNILETLLHYRMEQRPDYEFYDDSLYEMKMANGVFAIVGRLKTEMMRNKIVVDLLSAVHRGEDLTPAQERVLEIALAQEPRGQTDTIDRLTTRELDGWEPLMDPILAPIFEVVESARSYKDLIANIGEASKDMDSSKFVESLAVAMFKARGLGDGTDKP
jgi:phage gp29-like protein